MTTTITTVGVYLTEDERGHLTRLCNELEVMEMRARPNGPEAQARAAEQAALRKLMGLPAANAADDELQRLRAMERRLLEWATQLEANRDRPGDVGKFIAAELRNRMAGTP